MSDSGSLVSALTEDDLYRTNATRALAVRMLRGYKPTSARCPDCRSPLMTR
eukprot:CAMPEP_0181123970 /NCGR_PEP_ID=MMETSP1071-20121207/26211_1 /TAXON_ID=35127 /ORGANISM="Thalassiosira sp., Strain NH16" /LENGTH=50 /DNA_ID=CAMNT_0023209203 /DNA_START=50 /DNA_END=198 /DNA_ORIENTATION=+